MALKELIKNAESVLIGAFLRTGLSAIVPVGRAHMRLEHRRPTRWLERDGVLVPDPTSYELIGEDENWNLITNAGRDFLHTQGYATTGLGANGLNYIALSNDALTETATSTVLSTEITTNGLARAQGTVTHTAGTNTTTIANTFTASGAQSAQKAALFTAATTGTMNHVLSFTQRSLISGDTLQITFTITLG